MVFNQQIETCAPDLATDSDEFTIIATWEDVITKEPRATSRTYTFGELKAAGAGKNMLKGNAIAAYTDALVAYKQYDTSLMADAVAAVDTALVANSSDPDLLEIRSILLALY
jgi:Ca-activated chloride channel family protein